MSPTVPHGFFRLRVSPAVSHAFFCLLILGSSLRPMREPSPSTASRLLSRYVYLQTSANRETVLTVLARYYY